MDFFDNGSNCSNKANFRHATISKRNIRHINYFAAHANTRRSNFSPSRNFSSRGRRILF